MTDPEIRKVDELVAADLRLQRPLRIQNALQAFISANEDARSSPNFANHGADSLDGVVRIFSSPAVGESDELAVRVLKTLKILSRKYENRVKLGERIVTDLVRVLGQRSVPAVLGEAANVVLNICYERENVQRILQAGGVPPLVELLCSKDAELQANAAGAIQSICFQPEGRTYVRELGAIPSVLPLLTSDSLKVQTRAVGAIHNISSEPEAIRVIRRLQGIDPLVNLLRVPSAAVCGSAAGALQNLSRESVARQVRARFVRRLTGSDRVPSCMQEIRATGALVPLTDLLFGDDVQSQVCAAGAILNVLGPDLGPENDSNNERKAFKKLLSVAITIGMIQGPLRAERLTQLSECKQPPYQ
ncbi:MAG: hypothetical protein SGPRY_010741 [Prymnesium sp.]